MKLIKSFMIILILSLSITCYIDIPKLEEELIELRAGATTTIASGNLYDEMVLVPVAGKSLEMINAWNTNDTYVATISYDYYIGKYEVTYNLWYDVRDWAKSNGYSFANEGFEGNDGGSSAPTSAGAEPVTTVNWREVMVWCNAYSQKSGLFPCYTYNSSVIKDSRDSNATACDSAVCNWTANGYRLPTEAEWEFAARYIDGTNWIPYNGCSGYTGAVAFTGSNYQITEWGPYIWYYYNSSDKTQTVGTKLGNALGIHDMSGNVWEWSWDWYESYPADQSDYKGGMSGSYRVVRGGGCNGSADYIQVGARYDVHPYGASIAIGARLVRR